MLKEIIIYDPSVGTMNEGDKIIVDSAVNQLQQMFPYSKYIHLPTQMPVSKRVLDWYKNVDLRFVCGTNLLKGNIVYTMGRRIHFSNNRQWDFGLISVKDYGPAILLGCGWQSYQGKVDSLSAGIWNSVLSKEYQHSVRDDYTKQRLNEIGIKNVINTGCPTLWRLTESFCKEVPISKADNVITTITDYKQDEVNDQRMISILSELYNNVFVWLQGHEDDKYLKKLILPENVKILPGGVENFDIFLEANSNVEYVGTRLHGGIRALQHKRRSTIVAIDNRSLEMHRDVNINIIERNRIDNLRDLLMTDIPCKIHVPEKQINEFISQFMERQE